MQEPDTMRARAHPASSSLASGLKRPIHVLAPSPVRGDARSMPRRIALVSFPDCQSLDVTGPYEVFSAASRLAAAGEGYELTLLAPEHEPLRSESGLALLPDAALAGFRPGRKGLDTLLVCGGLGARRAAQDAVVIEQVRRLARSARRVASVCTGAFVLAGCGLLDGKRATTHWARCAKL